MRNIWKYLTTLIVRVKSINSFPMFKKKRAGGFPDRSGNLQVKIIRTLFLIPLVLFLEAEYYLIFEFNNISRYSSVNVSSITPENLHLQRTIYTDCTDTSDIKINILKDSTTSRFLRLSVKPDYNNKSIIIAQTDSIPSDAVLKIKCRSYEQQTVCQIVISDSLTHDYTQTVTDYYYYTNIPGKNWTDVAVPLRLFKSNATEITPAKYFQDGLIKRVKLNFLSKTNSAIDIKEFYFETSINKWPGIVSLVIILCVGLILFFRTTPQKRKYSKGLDLISASITARAIFFIVAVSAFISTFMTSSPTYRHEAFFIYILFLLMICVDEFNKKEIPNKTIWSFRYILLLIAAWFFRITGNPFILAPLTMAVLIPVIQQKRRVLLLIAGAGLLICFVAINKIRFFIPEITGDLIIVGATVIAIIMKEILFDELLKLETNYAKYLYENLFDNSYDGIFTTDENGIVKTANYGLGNMLGYPSEEMIGKNIFDFVVDGDHHLLKQMMEESVLKDFNMCDINFIDINKGIHTSLLRQVAIYKHDTLIGYQSISTDITERKQYEQELWKSQARYKALLNAMPDLVLKFNRDGVLLDYHSQNNYGSEKYFENLLGKKISNIFEPNVTQYFLIHAENALNKNCPQIFEFEQSNNGSIIFEEARIVPIKNDSFIAIIRDITDRRLAEFKIQEYLVELDDNRTTLEKNAKELAELNSKLEELNKSKDKFFSIVAHDLRSPFTGLLGFTDILSTQIESLTTDEIKTYTGHLNHSLKNVFKLLENLLDWSRMQTGKIKFEPANFNLREVIQRIVGVFQINASEKKIELDICIESCLMVYADEDMVDIIIRNLLSNAIKFTKPGGKVCISSQMKDDLIEITVSDNGIGILPESLSKLFKFDQNISTEGTARERGTGLGLVLCKEFIEKNGGQITIESKVNLGSKFTFTLPAEK
jgi:PAS domain S-box-containing protein